MTKSKKSESKKGILDYPKKALDFIQNSMEYGKTIKEIIIIGVSVFALFATDVPKDVANSAVKIKDRIVEKADRVYKAASAEMPIRVAPKPRAVKLPRIKEQPDGSIHRPRPRISKAPEQKSLPDYQRLMQQGINTDMLESLRELQQNSEISETQERPKIMRR